MRTTALAGTWTSARPAGTSANSCASTRAARTSARANPVTGSPATVVQVRVFVITLYVVAA